MKAITYYAQLARLDKPVGIWLIYIPALMGLFMAQGTQVLMSDMLLFFMGAFVMRSAGCTINDICDRQYDRQVARTKHRPLASGSISLRGALIFLGAQLLWALALVPLLNPQVWSLIPVALGLALTYPLFKRFTYAPQVYLGFCMNLSFLVAYQHVTGSINSESLIVFLGLVCWTIAYDTVYGHCDKKDDVTAGVKSLALHSIGGTKPFLYVMITVSFLMIAYGAGLSFETPLSCMVLGGTCVWQHYKVFTVNLDHPQQCLRMFQLEVYTGLLILLALMLRIFLYP